MLSIGPHKLKNALFLAPMVGVTDKPFREICEQNGAGLTTAEMLTSNINLWKSQRNQLKQARPRLNSPNVVQIAGSDPEMMAQAAEMNARFGADVIDINMGCPAKKVLKKAAGSALLKDLKLVRSILESVVNSVRVPVTLKIRTGWCPATKNGVEVAKIAEECGVRLLTIHGRTRECRFKGAAEYDTIARIKQSVRIPIIANGDINTPKKAAQVLAHTKADGLMIGRPAMGKPWLFDQIQHYLVTGANKPDPEISLRLRIIETHLKEIHVFYGKTKGVWYARKHVARYVEGLKNSKEFLRSFNKKTEGPAQIDLLGSYFASLAKDCEAESA
ncbi:MAG: tRNA dihydrouridine synthase DusB [Pseudohongiellaceae bacterium]|jgi:tRNA-dihydrouridine synthase B|tara:strand:- start:188 stop:1180 length:993 start_codon:yes stop_codon:yes gene_type:complete